MIFYFTGTGNSRWVAEALGTAFDEPLVSIADALNEGKNAYPLGEREKVFFVFPVHSWGPAVLVPRFISRLILSGYKGQEVYFVCTCGDDCGYTDRIMRSILARRGIAVTGGFSVQMPNNYVLMPGFDVDSKMVETEKLEKAPERVGEIVEAIRQKRNPSLYYAATDFMLRMPVSLAASVRRSVRPVRFPCRVTENRNGPILAFSVLPAFIVARCVR